MKCPRDDSELQPVMYESVVEVDLCPTCEGVWLDAGELRTIQETVVNDYTEELKRMPDYVGQAFSMAHAVRNEPIDCPVCGERLEHKEYAYCSQVYIDSCINGHGVWLDQGELQDLEVFFERATMQTKRARSGFFHSLLRQFRRG